MLRRLSYVVAFGFAFLLGGCSGHAGSIASIPDVKVPQGERLPTPPALGPRFIADAGRIAAPNIPNYFMPLLPPSLMKAKTPNSSAGANDSEFTEVRIVADAPYTGMLATITAFDASELQMPGTSPDNYGYLEAPFIYVPRSCFMAGVDYLNQGSGTQPRFFVIDHCANTLLYSTTIDADFQNKYVSQYLNGDVIVPTISLLIFTQDVSPGADSVWNAYIANRSTGWDLVASITGSTTDDGGGASWNSRLPQGPCPPLPLVSVLQSDLYDGSQGVYYPLAPGMPNGAYTAPWDPTSENCFMADSSGPATYYFEVTHPNDSWQVVSSTAPPSPGPIPTPTGATDANTGLITVAKGGTITLSDGSSLSVGANYVSEDEYVQVAEVPSASVSGMNTLSFAAIPGALDISSTPANSSENARVRRPFDEPSISAGTAILTYRTLPSAAYTDQTLPFLNISTSAGTLMTYSGPPSYDSSTGTITLNLPAVAPPPTSFWQFGGLSSLVDLDRLCGSPGVRFFDRTSRTWNAGAPPKKFYHPLLVFHGLFSCTEQAFPGALNKPLEALIEDGSYDAVIGYNYDWEQTPDVIVPQMASVLNPILGNARHVDVLAHSYGCIMAMGVIPSLQAQNVDNLVMIAGPLNGSFIDNANFLYTYMTSPLGIGAAGVPIIDAAALDYTLTGEDWRSTFYPVSQSPRLATIEANFASAANSPRRVVLAAGDTTPPLLDSLIRSISDGQSPETNDGVVTESSAQYSAVGENLSAAQYYTIPAERDPVIANGDSHSSELNDITLEQQIANELQFVYSNTDSTTTQFPLGSGYVVMKGDTTVQIGFTGGSSSTVAADMSSVISPFSASPGSVNANFGNSQSAPSSSAGDYITVTLSPNSVPKVGYDPLAIANGFIAPTDLIEFNSTLSTAPDAPITDAYSLKFYAIPALTSDTYLPGSLPYSGHTSVEAHYNSGLRALSGSKTGR